PGRRPKGESGPTSATVPISMPPEPVTGLCSLPRVAMSSRTAARIAAPSPPWASVSCRKLAASRLSRDTATRTSSGPIRGSGSNRQAACGSTRRPGGSLTRCNPTDELMLSAFTTEVSSVEYRKDKKSFTSVPYGGAMTQVAAGPVGPGGAATPGGRTGGWQRRELVEPDWTRLPGWRKVTAAQWHSAQWQRAHCVKNVRQLRAVLGDLVDERFYADLVADQQTTATMSMLLPPQMLNTMVPHAVPDTESFYADPVRRYMLPVASDRRTDWPSHPYATRDSLREHDMWVAEGLTHRYPTTGLAALLSTCPQYCGHCTRMDLVGNSTPAVRKLRLAHRPEQRYQAHFAYLRAHPGIRDVVVSGGDVANI